MPNLLRQSPLQTQDVVDNFRLKSVLLLDVIFVVACFLQRERFFWELFQFRMLLKMTVNLQAPIIINAEEKKACQIIVDTDKYPVRFPIYSIINELKKEGK